MITADSERLRAFDEAARSYNDAMVGLEDPARLAEAYILYAKKVAAIAAFRSLATSRLTDCANHGTISSCLQQS